MRTETEIQRLVRELETADITHDRLRRHLKIRSVAARLELLVRQEEVAATEAQVTREAETV